MNLIEIARSLSRYYERALTSRDWDSRSQKGPCNLLACYRKLDEETKNLPEVKEALRITLQKGRQYFERGHFQEWMRRQVAKGLQQCTDEIKVDSRLVADAIEFEHLSPNELDDFLAELKKGRFEDADTVLTKAIELGARTISRQELLSRAIDEIEDWYLDYIIDHESEESCSGEDSKKSAENIRAGLNKYGFDIDITIGSIERGLVSLIKNCPLNFIRDNLPRYITLLKQKTGVEVDLEKILTEVYTWNLTERYYPDPEIYTNIRMLCEQYGFALLTKLNLEEGFRHAYKCGWAGYNQRINEIEEFAKLQGVQLPELSDVYKLDFKFQKEEQQVIARINLGKRKNRKFVLGESKEGLLTFILDTSLANHDDAYGKYNLTRMYGGGKGWINTEAKKAEITGCSTDFLYEPRIITAILLHQALKGYNLDVDEYQ